jgi:hypothetical protein
VVSAAGGLPARRRWTRSRHELEDQPGRRPAPAGRGGAGISDLTTSSLLQAGRFSGACLRLRWERRQRLARPRPSAAVRPGVVMLGLWPSITCRAQSAPRAQLRQPTPGEPSVQNGYLRGPRQGRITQG